MKKMGIRGLGASLAVGILIALMGISIQPVLGDESLPGLAQEPEPLLRTQGGKSKKFDAVDATDSINTTSTTFADIPDMSVTWKQKRGGAAVIMFQAEWIGGDGRALIRVLVDGAVLPGPGDATAPLAVHEGSVVATNGFNFFTDKLSPGTHTVTIQWRSDIGDLIAMEGRSLIVLHK